MHKKKYLGQERRKYIRLDSAFPISFQLSSLDGKESFSDWLQGFTNNVGRGGICLVANKLDSALARLLEEKPVKISLKMEIPLGINPVAAEAKVAWMREIAQVPGKYLIGLTYEQIDASQNNKIMRYTWTKKLFVPVVFSIIFILGLGMLFNTYLNIKLIKGNKALVEQMVMIIQDSSVAKQKIKIIAKDKEDLQLKIQTLELRIQNAQEEKNNLQQSGKIKGILASGKIHELNAFIEKLIKDKVSLQEQLISIQHKENAITEELLRLDEAKAHLEKANIDKMYQWLKVNQNTHTALVRSFEGEGDISFRAFTYDQSLAAQAFIHFGDFTRARKIFEFFKEKAERVNGLFLNAYHIRDGSPTDYIIYSSPSIWMGNAILHYTKRSRDLRYLQLAEEIAQAIIYLQDRNKHGGICGGLDKDWCSVENNLDAHAFFDMLYKITNKTRYQKVRDRILNWLLQHTSEKLDSSLKHDRQDFSAAIDTYAWSVVALGPEKLEELGINPERAIEFTEESCAAEVPYSRPEGKIIKIKGFDFAAQKNLPKGRVISSEFSARMILAFKTIGDFYHKKGLIAKARAYKNKADEYLVELGKMAVSSVSPYGQGETCIPYVTQDIIDSGHGWTIPKGKSSGSLAGTAYTVFAYYKYNPLVLKE